MKKKFHIHVYKVEKGAEVEITTCEDADQARTVAVQMAKEGILDFSLKKPKLDYIAISFEK